MLRRLFILASLATLAALLCLWHRTLKTGDELSYVTRADTYFGIGTHPGGISFSRMTKVNARPPNYNPISPDEQRSEGFRFESYKWDEAVPWLGATTPTATAALPMNPSSQPVGTGSMMADSTTPAATLPTSEDPQITVNTVTGSASETFRFWSPPEHHFLGFGYQRITDQWVAADGTPVKQARALLAVPLWFLSLFLVIPAVYWIPAHRRLRRRLRAGQCVHCGYDLRGTPQRCPECGHVPRSSGPPHEAT